MDLITNPSSGEEIPNINWIISVLSGNKKNNGRPDPEIKSWAQPVKALMDRLNEICNLKGLLVLNPYRWPDGLTEFSGSSNI